MPRMQKRPFVETIRRKCEDTGTVKQVNYKHYYIPPFNSQGGTKLPTYAPKTRKNRSEIPGVEIKYYHTLEGAEAAHGEGSFVNNHTEEDFLKL